MKKGSHHTEESKKKIAQNTPSVAGVNNPMFGKHHSEETKMRISESLKKNKDRVNPNLGKPCSYETRLKISKSLMGEKNVRFGTHHTEETKKKISKANSGENSPNFGKHLPEETRKKISESNKGRVCSLETRKKISDSNKGKELSLETRAKLSEANKGENSPNFGKRGELSPRYGKPLSPETRTKISIANKGKTQSCETRDKISKSHKGITHSKETKIKLSIINSGEGNPNFGKTGENSPHWKGGISFEPYCPKWTRDLKRRIRAFFDHRCILCGKTTEKNGQDLSCHHVEYNKNACCDGKPVQFAALCRSCHSKTGFKRANWEFMIHRIIDEIYNNRSYFTKEEWKEIYGN
jgi:hypothetical protein